MRLLFVSPTDLSDPRGGRAMLARLHHDTLVELLGDRAAFHRLEASAAGLAGRLRGQVNGATPAGIDEVVAALDAHAADALWLDGSNLGRVAQGVRRLRPRIRILSFFHNVEAAFFLGALRRRPGIHAAGVLAGNYAAERLAVRHSDDLVALSVRDGAGLARLYGRGHDHILPMALADRMDRGWEAVGAPEAVQVDAPLLFVGGSFYANRAGIAWFAQAIAPHVPSTVRVVGQGMEAMRHRLRRARTIEIVGAVDTLHPHYRVARAAIAPILDGSGMKTKVAEALMFGKPVVGTPEAFSGYAEDVVAANHLCGRARDFIAVLGDLSGRPAWCWDPAMRAFYERDHSPRAVRARLAGILRI